LLLNHEEPLMKRTRIALLAGLSLMAASLLASPQAGAQGFPSKSVRIVIPFPPGGPTDQIGRMLAQKLQEAWGQTVVVDNRPGAGGQIAATQLKQAPADGHTLYIGDMGALAINATIYENFSFDPLRDFQPITGLMNSAMMVLVPGNSPSNTMGELMARGTGAGGRLNYASQGIGAGGHLAGEMLRVQSKANLNHVPYKGGAPAMQDLIAGQVDLFIDVLGSALPQARAGKVKMLAVLGPRRLPNAPDVPTTAEAGYPQLVMSAWFGMVTRAGVPEPVVRKLHDDVVAALASPDITRRLLDVGFEPTPTTPEQFGAFMREETERWGAVAKAAGVKVD
jgi:tripartite-type tricarboxylate transporter receptor subunit TctC